MTTKQKIKYLRKVMKEHQKFMKIPVKTQEEWSMLMDILEELEDALRTKHQTK